jgi:two-component system CheB/CheR fusion protein
MGRTRRAAIASLALLLGLVLLVLFQRNLSEPANSVCASFTFLALVVFAGVQGGGLYGVAATLIAILVASLFFDPPYYSRSLLENLRLVIYAVVGFVLSGICELLQRAWRGLAERQRRLEAEIVERRNAELALRAADRRKDEFLAILAHELRNPLAPLRSGLDILRIVGGPAEEGAILKMMDEQLNQMVRLIEDLLDISRIGRNKFELRPESLALRAVIQSAADAIRPTLDETRHEFHVVLPDESIHVRGDFARLSQVFGNLLSNAVKYTPSGGSIVLTTHAAAEEVIVTVRDTGIGIPTQALPHIFEMFSQVDRSLERTTGGLGIGLALVKAIVEMHGGTVVAWSEGSDCGAEFEVRLPREPTRPAPTPPRSADAFAFEPRRILVVDDNYDAGNCLALLLNRFGHETRLAEDGLEGLEVAEAFRPDVILLDIGMPRLNGYEAARRLRELPWGTEVRLIALTGWGQEEDRKKSRAAGFDAHLVKPVDQATLLETLARLPPLRAADSEAEAAAQPSAVTESNAAPVL